VPPLEGNLQVYNPGKDLTQLGEGFDIVAVPFTVSPISLLDKVKSMITPKTEWQGLTLEALKWKDTMVS
jgi:hypothetical protein